MYHVGNPDVLEKSPMRSLSSISSKQGISFLSVDLKEFISSKIGEYVILCFLMVLNQSDLSNVFLPIW